MMPVNKMISRLIKTFLIINVFLLTSFSVHSEDIEDSYKQLVANLDKQKEGDPTVAQLKDSITKKYAEFDKLKNRRAMEEVVEKQWTEGEYLS